MRRYGGDGYSVEQTNDNGYIVVGFVFSKIDLNGNISWTKTFDDPFFSKGRSVKQTTDGGYIITGETRFLGENLQQIFLIKADELGDTLWVQTYGGANTDRGHAVQQLSDNGYIIIGTTILSNPLGINIVFIRTNEFGDTLWTKNYGGYGFELGKAGQQTSDGGFIIVGETNSYGMGSFDIWLIKTDVNGDTLWTKTYGGTELERARDVHQTFDGGYIIAGDTESYGSGNSDGWIIRTDASGDTLWTKVMGGPHFDRLFSVRQTQDGGYILAGQKDAIYQEMTPGNLWLIRLAPEDFTAIDGSNIIMPNHFRLFQNFPNPFNNSTIIEYVLSKKSNVVLKIMDIKGNTVIELVNSNQEIGHYSVSWNGTSMRGVVPSGIYFYQLETSAGKQTNKMLFLK